MATARLATAPTFEPLAPEVMAQIRRIEIRARRLASSLLAGDYRSMFRGAGIEFAEAREYVPGDDVRLIDWNVTARTGMPWVKEYIEERELTVVSAVDVSASLDVARPETGRLAAAAEITALLSFAAAYNNDRAGILTFSDRIERYVPAARGNRHVLRLVREVLQHPPAARGTSIATACDYLARDLGRRSVVFLISDGFDQGYESALRSLARRHDVIAITLTDPTDLALPNLGLVEVQDVETGQRARIDSGSREARRRYAEAAAQRAASRHASLTSAGVDEITIEVGGDHITPIATYFRRRAARRGV